MYLTLGKAKKYKLRKISEMCFAHYNNVCFLRFFSPEPWIFQRLFSYCKSIDLNLLAEGNRVWARGVSKGIHQGKYAIIRQYVFS